MVLQFRLQGIVLEEKVQDLQSVLHDNCRAIQLFQLQFYLLTNLPVSLKGLVYSVRRSILCFHIVAITRLVILSISMLLFQCSKQFMYSYINI